MDAEFSRGDAYRVIAGKIKAEPLGEFYGEAALIYFHDALESGETPRMALAISNKETEWPELSPDDNSDTVPMPREITADQIAAIHYQTNESGHPTAEFVSSIQEFYQQIVAHLHPVSDARGDSE